MGFETFKVLTKEEEYNLFKKYRDENNIKARDTIVLSNIALCKKTVRKYTKHLKSMTYEDLLQESIIIVIGAIDKFDYTLGYKFSTYLVKTLENSISRYIMKNDRAVRLPVHVCSNYNKIIKRANYLQIDADDLKSKDYHMFKDLGLSKSEFVSAISQYKQIYSLDTRVCSDKTSTEEQFFINMLADTNYCLEDEIVLNELVKCMSEAVLSLDYTNKKNLKDIFFKSKTYVEYARANNITVYEVRKRVNSIIKDLKRHNIVNSLVEER